MPLTKDILERYAHSNVFVETGTWLGDGVELALQMGFNEIHSIEIDKRAHQVACEKFKDCNRVKLYLGNSGKLLDEVIENIDERITFWLDAHGSYSKESYPYPLIQELKCVSRHPIKEHTIIIDDIDYLATHGTSFEVVAKLLRSINPKYHLEKHQAKRRLLVAHIK